MRNQFEEDVRQRMLGNGSRNVTRLELECGWSRQYDRDLTQVEERSLKIVGDVIVAAVPDVEKYLLK